MEFIDIDNILNRNQLRTEISHMLLNMNELEDVSTKRGIYIHGNPGIGKTSFILNLLKQINMDVIYFDGSDLRNKLTIENIADTNISRFNVSKLLVGEKKQIVIVMDDIETMNTGDKGGINALSKLIRPKKTKKQRKEMKTTNPIICICNNLIDKKIKEIMKVCHVFELQPPKINQMLHIFKTVNNKNTITKHDEFYIQEMRGDLRKLNLYINNACNIFSNSTFDNCDVKAIVNNLFQTKFSFLDHNTIINETDRTIIALIYHENVAFVLNKLSFPGLLLYETILSTMCYADYLDRVTFQKQIWQFNEISSLLKTMFSNYLLHNSVSNPSNYIKQCDINFTKVLTKYSTEYNNANFFQQIAFKLNLEFDEILIYFKSIRGNLEQYGDYFSAYNISDVDINRIYRFIDVTENYCITDTDVL